MDAFRVKVMNRIAPEGLRLFGERYTVSPDEGDPQGIVVRSAEVDTAGYPSLLAVARAGAGVNNITVSKATEQGICVFNTPGANANAVAELVFIMLGICARNIDDGLRFCETLKGLPDDELAATVEKKKSAYRGFELAGKTLGVLGLGKIGVRVANGGIHRRMRVLGFDPFPAMENIHVLDPEVKLAGSMGEVVAEANILTLHMPLSEKNRGLVGAELIRKLPEGAVLVNYARGQIVDEDAVIAALRSGRLGGYITDFPTRAILSAPRVIATPHLGASTEESEENCAVMAVEELRSYLELGNVSHSVNFPTAESIPSGEFAERLIVINRDVPGVIGVASQAIGESGVNIGSYLNESNGEVGYNIIDVASPIPAEVIERIQAHPDVIRTRVIRF